MKKLTLIIPCFNEEENIFPFYELARNNLSPSYSYQFIYINDGSTDGTMENIKNLIDQNPNQEILGINFSRNFGKEAAILAGLKRANGDFMTIIDCDLQQNPKYVSQMLDILENNPSLDMVAAYQDVRDESKVLKGFKSLFYSLINKISDTKFEKNASDFRTFRANVRDSILELREYNRFSKGLFAWVGYNVEFIPYKVEKRVHGQTSWSFRSLTRYAIEGFVGYSTLPLRIATVLGFISSLVAGFYMVYVVGKRIFGGVEIPGYATIVTLILLLSGLQLLSLGILGEYLARTYLEVKNRPHYIIKDVYEKK